MTLKTTTRAKLRDDEVGTYYAWLWIVHKRAPAKKPKTVDSAMYRSFKRAKIQGEQRTGYLASG